MRQKGRGGEGEERKEARKEELPLF